MALKTWPTLYQKDSLGRLRSWNISVEHSEEASVIIKVHGLLDGQKQTDVETILTGKNIGKKNETTRQEQAELDADSDWKKKINREGYLAHKESAEAGIDPRPGFEPMLAHRFDQHPDKIEWPCYIQPKLNGHRMLADICGNLFSRKREVISGLPHINQHLHHFVARHGLQMYVENFDGEAYNHNLSEDFEDLTGFIRSKTPKTGHEIVEYHLYDLRLPDKNAPFYERLSMLTQLQDRLTLEIPIKIVPTYEVQNEAEAMARFNEFKSAGYEGAILRNRQGIYVGERSYDLQKIKSFQDAEFTIIGVEEGKGRMAGHAIFVCKTAEGVEFRAKMKGSMDRLQRYFVERDKLIGKQVTVMFHNYTKQGAPLHPVALHLREDI